LRWVTRTRGAVYTVVRLHWLDVYRYTHTRFAHFGLGYPVTTHGWFVTTVGYGFTVTFTVAALRFVCVGLRLRTPHTVVTHTTRFSRLHTVWDFTRLLVWFGSVYGWLRTVPFVLVGWFPRLRFGCVYIVRYTHGVCCTLHVYTGSLVGWFTHLGWLVS